MNLALEANNGGAEYTTSRILSSLSNGFLISDSNAAFNGSGDTYIYAAFAENPFKYSLAR